MQASSSSSLGAHPTHSRGSSDGPAAAHHTAAASPGPATCAPPPTRLPLDLHLVLRFAHAAHALGIQLSSRRRGGVLVVLVRMLGRELSLPAFVQALHLFRTLRVQVRMRGRLGRVLFTHSRC